MTFDKVMYKKIYACSMSVSCPVRHGEIEEVGKLGGKGLEQGKKNRAKERGREDGMMERRKEIQR